MGGTGGGARAAAGAGGAAGSAGAAGGGGAAQACDDVAAQFLPAGTNPNGVWSYGWIDLGSTTFVPYTLYSSDGLSDLSGSTGLLFWYANRSSAFVEPPLVGYNPTSSENHYAGTVSFEPGQFVLYPGSAGQQSVARWTAMKSGRYNVTATFTGLSGYNGTPVTTTNVSIVTHTATSQGEIFGFVNLNGAGNATTASFDGLPVSAGDTVDFTVEEGNNANASDSTALSAQICLL